MPNRRELGYVSAGSTNTVYVSTGIYGRATGGIGSPTAVTISGVNYEYLTFNSTGTLTVTTAGWFDYLAIGGGGGSLYRGTGGPDAGGGGGGGQVLIGSVYLSANQTITVGGGGSFWNVSSVNFGKASDTVIAATSPFTQTASGNLGSHAAGVSVGFIGGGVGSWNGVASANITTAYGFKGGDAAGGGTSGGGGGGQSAAGGNAVSTTGGAGGAGFDVSVFIGGSELRKAMGGGGGGSVTGGSAATGGVAGSATTTPSNAGANTGGGGGAGYGVCTTGNGGSGICYIRWQVA